RLHVAALEFGDGEGGVGQGAAAGSALPAGVLVGLRGETVDLVGFAEVAEAEGGLAEQVRGVNEARPFRFVLGDDALERLLGADDSLRGRRGVAEAGLRPGLEGLHNPGPPPEDPEDAGQVARTARGGWLN